LAVLAVISAGPAHTLRNLTTEIHGGNTKSLSSSVKLRVTPWFFFFFIIVSEITLFFMASMRWPWVISGNSKFNHEYITNTTNEAVK
jgi:hypothetical protein